jgi:cell division ATPase FtsA
MFNDCVATLNIGSADLTLSVAERSVNGAFFFRAIESVNYYPYFDGEFYDVKELELKIATLFNDLISKSDVSKISTVFVGVPGEFSKILTKNYKITYGKVRKIQEVDVRYLFDTAFQDDDTEYKLVNRSASYFVVDNYKTHEPIGKKASSLSARIFFGLVINHFVEVLTSILTKLGVLDVKFILQDYADVRYLFSTEERDDCKLLINVGYSSSTLSIACGDGLLHSKSFPLGGGMISAYLSDGLGCEFKVAEALKNKLNLGLKDRESASYIVAHPEFGEFAFSRNESNKIAKSVLDDIGENCDKAVSSCTLKVPSDIEVAFTGEGICSVRGAVEYMAARLGVFPTVKTPQVPHYDKPNFTSRLALIDTALDLAKNKLFFTKID